MVEKIEQGISALTLAMGLCLMWDGYSNISQASKVSRSPVVLVPAGHDGKLKGVLVDFLKKRYMLPSATIEDVTKGRLPVPASLRESSLCKRGFVLEDYPRTKDEAQHVATLVKHAYLSSPIIVEIADPGPRDLPLDFGAHHTIFPDVDVWTIDGTQPLETVSETLRTLLDKIPNK